MIEPTRDAFLIVDPQIDFCPGGALPVAGADRIFGAVNELTRPFQLVVASRDWHPADHISFAERGGPWPPHCVAGTPGADFHPLLEAAAIHRVVDKGADSGLEAYSAFSGTDLEPWLRAQGVERLFVAGLATDYCVKNSVLDALQAGFEVVVVSDAIAAVEANPGDEAEAIAAMRRAGASFATSASIR